MILSDRSLREAIAAGRIVIDPLDESCIQPSSIDVRVVHLFRVFRNHTAGIIDVKQDLEDLTELIEIAAGRASSCSTPASSCWARPSSASPARTTSWRGSRASRVSGRLGLLIHSTAGFIDAGFDGHITLELANVASLPITIYPGMKIGQVSFLQHDDAGRQALRLGRRGLQVPGPAGPDAEPLLRELPQERRLTAPDADGVTASAVGVEVAQEGELGAVVDHFAVDVEHEQTQRASGNGSAGPHGRAIPSSPSDVTASRQRA